MDSREEDFSSASWLSFPTSPDYSGSRLDDVRVMPFFCAPYEYESMHSIDKVNAYWTVSFVKRGLVTVTTMGRTWQARSGDLLIFPPYVMRSEVAEGPGLHEYFFMNATIAERFDLFRFYPVAPVITISAPDKYTDLFKDLRDAFTTRSDEFWGLHSLAATMKILAFILTEWRKAGSPMRPQHIIAQDGRFADVMAYMHSHLEEKTSRDDLARVAHLHPVHLDRTFKEMYGMSSKQMLRVMRLHKAKDLLENTEMTLDAVADASGLGTAQYLVHVFHRHFNMTPNDYRKSFKSVISRYVS